MPSQRAEAKEGAESSTAVSEIPEDVAQKIPGFIRQSCVLVGPRKYCFLRQYVSYFETFYNFAARPDDVWIFGIPRSGSTLLQEMVWLLGNNFDYEKASENVMDIRFPTLGNMPSVEGSYEPLVGKMDLEADIRSLADDLAVPAWTKLDRVPEGKKRFIKTHLPISLFSPALLQSGCKIIYLARNPKDVCVSLYHLAKAFGKLSPGMDFPAFWTCFKLGLILYCPYFEHVKEGWDLRGTPNFKFLFYEEYTVDMEKTVSSLADFLGTSPSRSQLDGLLDHLKIDNFRTNKSVNNDHLRSMGLMRDQDNNFIRKGKIGGWRDYFTGGMVDEVDRWIEENLKETGIQFPA